MKTDVRLSPERLNVFRPNLEHVIMCNMLDLALWFVQCCDLAFEQLLQISLQLITFGGA